MISLLWVYLHPMAKCNIDIRGTPLAVCQAGGSVARKWRWALRGSAAQTQLQTALEGTPPQPQGSLRIHMPSYFCKKSADRTSRLKISPERGLETVIFSIISPSKAGDLILWYPANWCKRNWMYKTECPFSLPLFSPEWFRNLNY